MDIDSILPEPKGSCAQTLSKKLFIAWLFSGEAMYVKEVVRSSVVAGGHRLTFPKNSLRQYQLMGCLSLLEKGQFLEYKFKD